MKMINQREVSQQQQQENQQPPRGGGATTTGGAAVILPRSSSSACDCIEPFGIVLAVISIVGFICFRFVIYWNWWWPATIISFLLTLVAVVCLFRAAKRYQQNEQQQQQRGQASSSSSVGVVWMVLSWVFCTVAGVMAIVDVVSYFSFYYVYYGNDDDYIYYNWYDIRWGIVTLVGMFIASVCMLIYAEKSRRSATTGHLTQSTNVVVGDDTEAPVHDEPSVETTPPTVIAHQVRGSVLAQEAEEQTINNHNNNAVVVEVLPTGSYYMPHNKDQCRSVVAPAPRAMVIGDPIHGASRIVQQPGQRQQRAAIDP